jgi:hypothetical protein
MRKQN